MARRYNPPPNWPPPPTGWEPEPGWTPDPGWPPTPPGWQLWLDDIPTAPPRRQKRSRRFVIVGSVILLALIVGVALAFGDRGGSNIDGADSEFFPQGDSSAADGPYLDLLREWNIRYSDPYEAVAIGRKSCELMMGRLPGASDGELQSQGDVVSAMNVVEATIGSHLPEYTDSDVHLIVSAALNKLCPIEY